MNKNDCTSSAAIMIDGKLLCKVKIAEAVSILMTSFYVFNIEYTSHCANLFHGLECIFFYTPPANKVVRSIMSQL